MKNMNKIKNITTKILLVIFFTILSTEIFVSIVSYIDINNLGAYSKSIISSNTRVLMILSMWMIFTRSTDTPAFIKQMPGM